MRQTWSLRRGLREDLNGPFLKAFKSTLHRLASNRVFTGVSPTSREDWEALQFQIQLMGWGMAVYGTYQSREPKTEGEVLDLVEAYGQLAFPYERSTYRTEVNALFERFNQSYVLDDIGYVRRVGSVVLDTGVSDDRDLLGFRDDPALIKFLDQARVAFFDARSDRKLEGLRMLYDAWERAKTLAPGDKKTSAGHMAATIANAPKLEEAMSTLMRTLTDIGNNANIRHSETEKFPLDGDSTLIEMLFYNVYAILRAYAQRRTSEM